MDGRSAPPGWPPGDPQVRLRDVDDPADEEFGPGRFGQVANVLFPSGEERRRSGHRLPRHHHDAVTPPMHVTGGELW